MAKFIFLLLALVPAVSLAQIRSKGKYEKGAKAGVWEYFLNDTLIQKMDHTTGELLYFKPAADTTWYNIKVDSGAWTKAKVDRAPLYLSGKTGLYAKIYKDLQVPAKAAKLSGKVTVAFTVDPKGVCKDHRVSAGLGAGCDEEALRVVKTASSGWLPAVKDNKAVACEYAIDVFFNAAR